MPRERHLRDLNSLFTTAHLEIKGIQAEKTPSEILEEKHNSEKVTSEPRQDEIFEEAKVEAKEVNEEVKEVKEDIEKVKAVTAKIKEDNISQVIKEEVLEKVPAEEAIKLDQSKAPGANSNLANADLTDSRKTKKDD